MGCRRSSLFFVLSKRLAFMIDPANKIIIDFNLPSVLDDMLAERKIDGNSSRISVSVMLEVFNLNIIPLPCETTARGVRSTKRSFVEDMIGLTDSELIEQYIRFVSVIEAEIQ